MLDEEKGEVVELPDTNGLPDGITDDIPYESDPEPDKEEQPVDEQDEESFESEEGESEDEDESVEDSEDEDMPEWKSEYESPDEMYEAIRKMNEESLERSLQQKAEDVAENAYKPEDLSPEKQSELLKQFYDATQDEESRAVALTTLVQGVVESEVSKAVEEATYAATAPMRNFMAVQQKNEMLSYIGNAIGNTEAPKVFQAALKFLDKHSDLVKEPDHLKLAVDTILGREKYRKVAAQRLFDSQRKNKSLSKKKSTPKGRTQAPKANKTMNDKIVDAIFKAESDGLG